jgi:hypothetical protein
MRIRTLMLVVIVMMLTLPMISQTPAPRTVISPGLSCSRPDGVDAGAVLWRGC